MITKNNVKDIYSLSPMQEGMLYLYMVEKDRSLYTEQSVFEISGEMDILAFEESFNKLIEKYDVFRTMFSFEKGKKNLQGVLKERKAKINFKDIASLQLELKEVYISDFMKKDVKQGFDIKKDILTRIAVLKTDPNVYKIIWTFHHIIIDGWCLPIIIRDFFLIYSNIKNKKILSYKEAKPYSEYIKWIKSQDKKKTREYWKKYLEGYDNRVKIPQSTYILNKEYRQEVYEIVINEEEMKMLNNFSITNSVTINCILQVAWSILLNKFNNTHDAVFGIVVSGRPSEIIDVEKMVGLFINTIPIRINYKDEETFNGVVKRIQESLVNSLSHSYLSLSEIQSLSKVGGELVNHILIYENYPSDKELNKLSKATGFDIILDNCFMTEKTNYNFEIVVSEKKDLSIKFRYNSNVYEEKAVIRIGEQMKYILDQIAYNAETKIGDINILTDKYKNELTYDFNSTQLPFLNEKSLHGLFEEQVSKAPKEIAIMFKNQYLSYGELNSRSNQLARILINKGVRSESVVAIMVERSLEMIIGILAILKAGGAYLPIDPNYPKERIKYMINDSNALLILTQGKLNSEMGFQRVTLDLNESNYYLGDESNLDKVSNNDLAYIIYTSGSTGNPKGVMIEHKSIVNRLLWMQNKYNLTKEDVILQKTPFTFDVSVWELFWWAIAGAKMCILEPGMEKSPNDIIKTIDKFKVTTIHFVPSMFSAFLNYISQYDNYAQEIISLKRIFTSGEELKVNHVERFNSLINETKLINLYGPTEAAVDVTYYECLIDKEVTIVPIGRPISNIDLYILDDNKNLVPVGAVGELYISGIGLARGYINNSELTKAKFIPNIFSEGERMYRTGDLARWLSDGNIEFLGRMDNQVKIRGFRIEIEEIENCILKHEYINEAIVIKKNNEEHTFLCAYIVAKQEVTVHELRNHMLKYLPEYMIPEQFIRLECIPLGSNGKLDIKRLMGIGTNIATGLDYMAPRSDIEKGMVKMWSEVLNVEDNIGIKDNFFELGGHSIKAMELSSKTYKLLGIHIPIQEVLKNPTIEQLSNYVAQNLTIRDLNIKKTECRDYYPLSPEQMRIFMAYQMDKNAINYNMPTLLTLEGHVDINKLKTVFNQLILRHESLRTVFNIINGKPVQIIQQNVEFKMKYSEDDENEVKNNFNEIIQPFNLEKGPLFRVQIIKTSISKYIMIIDFHHIIADEKSIEIMINEITKLYEGKTLDNIVIQYKDYVNWQQERLNKNRIKELEEYWLNVFSEGVPVLEIPIDYLKNDNRVNNGSCFRIEIDNVITKKLKTFCGDNNVTLYMFLLSVYNVLFYNYLKQNEIVIATPVSGRVHSDLDNVIGIFVNMLLMKNNPKENKTFIEFLHEVKENTLQAYANQEYQFNQLVAKLCNNRDLSGFPLARTIFNLINSPVEYIQLDDLKITCEKNDSKLALADIVFTAVDFQDYIRIEFQYNVELFKEETIQTMVKHLIFIINEVIDNKTILLQDIDLSHKLIEAKANIYDDIDDFDFNL